MVTMRDVARTAGVSVGTVSNFVNERGLVAEVTAARIQQAIDELGYSVDVTARAFRKRRSYSIGLVVPTIANPYFDEIARVVAHDLWENGLQTFLCDAASDAERERRHLEQLVSRRVDGILISHSGDAEALRHFVAPLTTPIVFFDRALPDFQSVDADNRLGGELAARHLADLGHRRVGVLAGDSGQFNVRERLEGFVSVFAKRDCHVEPRHILRGPQALELGFRVGELMRDEPRPTAVFCTNDIVAVGAWRTLVELGHRIPDDVSLVGFDDIEMSRLTIPQLTTVAQDKVAIGRAATGLLLRLIRGEQRTLERISIPPSLVVRGSTTAPLVKEVAHAAS